jgi:succinate dehydrogenase hydrophobic anchor subunit
MNSNTLFSPRVDFGGALRRALDARLLALWTAWMLLPTAVVTVPLWRVLADALDHSPRADAFARQFDMLMFTDVGVACGRSSAALTGAAWLAAFIALASYPLLTGMTLAQSQRKLRGEPSSGFVVLAQDAIAWYGRALRIAVVALVPLILVGIAAALTFKAADRYAAHVLLQSQANLARRAVWALALVTFVLVHATVEAGRAALAADAHLQSAWRAWLRGVALTARCPIAVLGVYLGVTLVSLGIAAALTFFRLHVAGGSTGGFALGVLMTELGVVAIGWGRAGRLFALAALTQSSVRPASR